MKRIAIIGAGQAGLQLGLGLLQAGYEVLLYSGRSAGAIRSGHVMSSQCMFDLALQTERDLGINLWEAECPRIEGIGFAIPGPAGGKAIEWAARLDNYAQSVDQRLKIPAWMEEFDARGGQLRIREAGLDDLESCTRSHDLVIVASGKGELAALFERDAGRSPFEKPQRALALTYVRDMLPREPFAAVCFNLLPNVGEYFVFPALTTTGPCEIMVFEGLPGGPMDCWDSVAGPEQHLAKSKWILETFFPWEAERCRHIELTDENGILSGRFAPTVRRPVGSLPSGAKVLGMADAVVLNDPITGQGSNDAAKCAEIYLESILERGEGAADAEWMQQTFDRYWSGYARWVVTWTNLMLRPPAHVFRILDKAGKMTAVATALVNGFDDPRTFFPWFTDPAETDKFLEAAAREVGQRFDRRDLRRALGQFATGVTVVTACASDGRRVGVTVNSFASVSLDPPLILWSLSRQAASFRDFTSATHFAVNVLEAGQHHLSRQFSTPVPDKFAGVECEEGPNRVPLLKGVAARFLCRTVQQYDGGDHVILLGEVESYTWREGEPLVFHSGRYRAATRHPDISE
ncbi:MAG: styrene monooxygenase/indole monooxygenase family protein [Terriglobales bacterium]